MDEISDQLYALPPDEFTQARNLVERDLRAAGKREQADQVKALRKPTAAGAVNRPTLQATVVDDDIARALLAARLVREPEPAGFGTLLAHADPAAARTPAGKRPTARPSPAKTHAKPSLARAELGHQRLQEAKRMLGVAAAEERQARRRLQQAQRELEKAQAAVEKAQRKLDRLRDR